MKNLILLFSCLLMLSVSAQKSHGQTLKTSTNACSSAPTSAYSISKRPHFAQMGVFCPQQLGLQDSIFETTITVTGNYCYNFNDGSNGYAYFHFQPVGSAFPAGCYDLRGTVSKSNISASFDYSKNPLCAKSDLNCFTAGTYTVTMYAQCSDYSFIASQPFTFTLK